jgi:hypothetical protein
MTRLSLPYHHGNLSLLLKVTTWYSYYLRIQPILHQPLHVLLRPANQQSDYANRVQKQAFACSQEIIEVLQPDNPGALPEVVAKSPYAAKVLYSLLLDPVGKPAVTAYLNHFVEENPLTDSQEGYELVTGFLQSLDGKAKKKRSKKNTRK